MKKFLIALTLLFSLSLADSISAQTAKEVLDKCAATLNTASGLKADFTMHSAQYGSASGTIALKGRMFHASTPVAAMWFDGKTQWTYMKKNDEVNVSNPSQAQLQTLNPYNFINMYKQGYKYTMTKDDNNFTVHLTSTGKKQISEMFITVDKKSYQPTQVKLLQGKKWTTFTIANLTKAAMADSDFRFNSKDYPTAEVIDLR